jgi:hypothetical protein
VRVDALQQISQNVCRQLETPGISAMSLTDVATALGLIAAILKRDLQQTSRPGGREQARTLDAVLGAVFGLEGLEPSQMHQVLCVASERLSRILDTLPARGSTRLSA